MCSAPGLPWGRLIEMPPSVKRDLATLDLFAGAGGSSCGARQAGADVVAGVDMWSVAKDTFLDNFDGADFFSERAERIAVKRIARELGDIHLLLVSPDCTNHTCAKGNGTRSEASRMTAFQAIRFAKELRPRWVIIENVIHMRPWKRYQTLISQLGQKLGYHIREQVLNAWEFGVPQARKRLFIICDLKSPPPEIRPSPGVKSRVASDVVDICGPYKFSPLRTPGRARPTLQRAKRAISEIGDKSPFLIVYYGTDGCGGWQRLDAPLRTITTLDRFALVKPTAQGHMMRMLQVPELKNAMGFPASFRLDHGTRRDKIRLLGNGVCPPVMRAIVRTISSTAE